jgi:decaprenylphospho-beta-D-ribofuranose 2-oxidase
MSERIAGWGNYPRIACEVRAPEEPAQVAPLLDAAGTIARGLGRSYGDPALVNRGVVLKTAGLDRMLAFDAATGTLTCEGGTSLESILTTFVPRGYLPMVTPGTKYVTVAGCLANDVHGKAHHADFCFSEHVDSVELLLANGERTWVSRQNDPELFWATAGGLGLTGVILTVKLRLRKVETAYFRQRAIIVKDLSEMLAAIEENDAIHPYSVAWIDPLAVGKRLGRGVLTVGDHAKLSQLPDSLRDHALKVSKPSPISVPFELPEFVLNTASLRLLNVAIYQMQARGAAFAHYEKFFYPLDMFNHWNRGYGARGFTQYQFVIPFEDGERRMRGLLERIAKSGFLPFLNVLKRMGKQGQGHLSFPFAGWTFAIDFPIAKGLETLLWALDREVIEAGGRIYLGKDAFLQPQSLPQMYPRLDEWFAIKDRVDPRELFRSALSDRVGLTGALRRR